MEVQVQTTLEELVDFFTIKMSPLTITFEHTNLYPNRIKHNGAPYMTKTCRRKFIHMTLVDIESSIKIYWERQQNWASPKQVQILLPKAYEPMAAPQQQSWELLPLI